MIAIAAASRARLNSPISNDKLLWQTSYTLYHTTFRATVNVTYLARVGLNWAPGNRRSLVDAVALCVARSIDSYDQNRRSEKSVRRIEGQQVI